MSEKIYTGNGWEIRCGKWQDSPPESVDVVISDPPYSEHVHKKQWIGSALTKDGAPRCSTAFSEIGFSHITEPEQRELTGFFVRAVARWALVFTDLEGLSSWADLLPNDYIRSLVWDKVDSAPQFTGDRPASAAEAIACFHRPGKKRWNGGGRRNVFRYTVNAERGSKPHPTTKPLPLMLDLVRLFSDPDELVWDPYCGSGTTGVACLRLGRRFLGHEMQPHYAEIAAERLRAEEDGQTLQQRRAGQTSLIAKLNAEIPDWLKG